MRRNPSTNSTTALPTGAHPSACRTVSSTAATGATWRIAGPTRKAIPTRLPAASCKPFPPCRQRDNQYAQRAEIYWLRPLIGTLRSSKGQPAYCAGRRIGYTATISSPSPPSEGGEGWGEEARSAHEERRPARISYFSAAPLAGFGAQTPTPRGQKKCQTRTIRGRPLFCRFFCANLLLISTTLCLLDRSAS